VIVAARELADPAHELVVTFGLGLGRHVPAPKRQYCPTARERWQSVNLFKITMRFLDYLVQLYI
jgi:hypothetical protein